MEEHETYDLLIVTDATSSMSDYLTSLQTSLPQIISISALTGCFSRIGLIGYRDYCDDDLLEWSGWLHQSADADGEQPDLVAKAKSIAPLGGGDFPEATKTALAKAYEVMRADVTTIILLYTDAPPHASVNSMHEYRSNHGLEKDALSAVDSYGGFGPSFVDWVSAAKRLRSGEKKAQVFCMLEPEMSWNYVGYYNYLCTMTGGSCIYLKDAKPMSISKVTVEVLLAWMGVEKAGTVEDKKANMPASLSRYINIENIKKVKNEEDTAADSFFMTTSSQSRAHKLISSNITSADITSEVLKKYIPKKKTPISDFAKSWTTDAAYRVVVVENLRKIIDTDVRAISFNPVFGSLWRAVCNDRTLDARDSLISAFGMQIDRIVHVDEKAQMKAWLEESYDYTAEVKDIVDSVPENERFPYVCLDPTLNFVLPIASSEDENDANKPITAFKRDELLDIGRSCDYKILRRLGRILTRLTYVESAADVPEHIAMTTDDEVPKIPMALASKERGRQFWRILLHIIVPGTMLSARPAALLAALSLRLGIEPLAHAAENEMLIWRNRWNDINVPENWNVSCLSLLLDADRAYRQRQQDVPTSTNDEKSHHKSITLIKDDDRTLFERLIAFKMLELNLDTALMAQTGWTPEKTAVPIGPVAVCRSCQYPRSVTIMGRSGKCGHCLDESYISPAAKEKCIHTRVTKEDGELTPLAWVECSIRTCRAQYVVYNLEALNVRPKCFYCRSQIALPIPKRSSNPAPWVECTKCLNRIIWPESYRPSSFSKADFSCPPCKAGLQTITDIETTAKKISAENTMTWLVKDSANPDKDPFTNRSLYHTVSAIGVDHFLHKIQVFPPTASPLHLKGKLIRNPTSLTSTLQDLISLRQISRAPCSLCFTTLHPSALNPACGRRSCFQRICRACLLSWYGLNAPGRILNTAALTCPFCRRAPSARTLHKYGMGIHAVANLREAVREKGTWIYAWCADCGTAKQYVERVCARGMPTEISNWNCPSCIEEREAARLQREREQAERLLRDAQIAMNAQAVADAEALRERLIKEGHAHLRREKPCPGCGTMTEKVGGCDHITCPVKRCGTHWCFHCGQGFTSGSIYTHMSREHDSYYWDGEEGEEDEDLYRYL